MEKLYRNWEHGLSIKLILANRTWDIGIECLGERCAFGKGWNEFVKGVELKAGDILEICHDPLVAYNILNVCVYPNREPSDRVGEGKYLTHFTTP